MTRLYGRPDEDAAVVRIPGFGDRFWQSAVRDDDIVTSSENLSNRYAPCGNPG